MSDHLQNLNRRQFLSATAATAVLAGGYWVCPIPGKRQLAPLEKLNLAIVGTGNKGWHNVEQLRAHNIVALCDVDQNFLNKAAQEFPRAKTFRDYRKMIDSAANDFDAVVVSTSDHTHAPATSVALDVGKHVYCEKPLTHTVAEARAIAKLAEKNKLATQMGIQIHAGDNYRRVVEIVQSGSLGTITDVYCWCNKGWSDGRFSQTSPPVPAHLDWDLWLGPATKRPYADNVHPANWRRFWEYGSGTFGDMACHVVDLPFWALGLTQPTYVKCVGPELHPDGAPAWTKATYQFPVKDSNRKLNLYWSDGGQHFDVVKQTNDHSGQPLANWGLGILFVGEKGSLVADYGRYQFLPKEKADSFAIAEQTIESSIGHWDEWVKGCQTGSPTTCSFDYSGNLTETVLLGIVAYRTGKELQWNASQLKATNCPDAEQFVTKEYRAGFEVVGLK
jgi:predicted dehydrogenase